MELEKYKKKELWKFDLIFFLLYFKDFYVYEIFEDWLLFSLLKH